MLRHFYAWLRSFVRLLANFLAHNLVGKGHEFVEGTRDKRPLYCLNLKAMVHGLMAPGVNNRWYGVAIGYT